MPPHALASEITALAPNIVAKHRWVNRAFALTAQFRSIKPIRMHGGQPGLGHAVGDSQPGVAERGPDDRLAAASAPPRNP